MNEDYKDWAEALLYGPDEDNNGGESEEGTAEEQPTDAEPAPVPGGTGDDIIEDPAAELEALMNGASVPERAQDGIERIQGMIDRMREGQERPRAASLADVVAEARANGPAHASYAPVPGGTGGYDEERALRTGTGGKHDADRDVLSEAEVLDAGADGVPAPSPLALQADAAIASIVRAVTSESAEREQRHYEETDKRLAALTIAVEQMARAQSELLKAQKEAVQNEAYRPRATVSDAAADDEPLPRAKKEKKARKKAKEAPEADGAAAAKSAQETAKMPAIREMTAEEVIAEKEAAAEAEEAAARAKKGKRYSAAPKEKGRLGDKLFGALCIGLLVAAVLVLLYAASRVLSAVGGTGAVL